jgi:hypothetical protein
VLSNHPDNMQYYTAEQVTRTGYADFLNKSSMLVFNKSSPLRQKFDQTQQKKLELIVMSHWFRRQVHLCQLGRYQF